MASLSSPSKPVAGRLPSFARKNGFGPNCVRLNSNGVPICGTGGNCKRGQPLRKRDS